MAEKELERIMNSIQRPQRLRRSFWASTLLVIGFVLFQSQTSLAQTQTPVTTAGGNNGKLPKWQSAFVLTDSVVTETSGNIGIGTTTPAGLLHTKTNDAVNFFILDSGLTGPSYSDLLFSDRGGKTWELVKPPSNDFGIYETNFDYRVYVKAGGNVGIGTTAPAAKLDVAGSANVTGNVTV